MDLHFVFLTNQALNVLFLFAGWHIISKAMKKDLDAMKGIFSEKTMLFFQISIYRKYIKLATAMCLVFSAFFVFSFLPNLTIYLRTGNWSNYKRMNDISRGVFAFIWWVGYIGFIFKKTQIIFITFKKVNPNAQFMRDYCLTHNEELNKKLNVVVTRFLERLDKLTSKHEHRKNMLAIYKLFMFYLNLVQLKAKDNFSEAVDERFMFQSKDDHVNLYEMLQMVNQYFNSFDIETKILFSSKFVEL